MSESDDESRETLMPAEAAGQWPVSAIDGLRMKELYLVEGGLSIALLNFEKGSGIKRRHRHASNQFMYCLSGKYSYESSGLELSPGDFYWNAKGGPHGPTTALEDSVLLEIYDGPHYFAED
jgi:2,4'-dihydroxyacetophenone dioxygenase